MRAKRAKKRPIVSDPIYKSKQVTRMINVVMVKGKKSLAQKIVYGTLDKLAEDRKDALKLFEKALKNVMPSQEVRSRRVGGATYQVPYPLKHDRAEALAIRWLVRAAGSKKGSDMITRLHKEIIDASEGTGEAVKKKHDVHRAAEANRAFAHFARF